MDHYGFFKTTMPETRKADFYLGCFDGSVIIDFNLNSNNQVYLQRISFDRYGFCGVKNSKTLDDCKSLKFVKEMNKEIIDQKTIEQLVKRLIMINSEQIWTDALREYEIIENS